MGNTKRNLKRGAKLVMFRKGNCLSIILWISLVLFLILFKETLIENRGKEEAKFWHTNCSENFQTLEFSDSFFDYGHCLDDYLGRAIIPPWNGSNPWRFQLPQNQNYSAFDFYKSSKDSCWIDVLVIMELCFPKNHKKMFVECGGSDGESFSNTIFLEKFKNWSGLVIEADQHYFQYLLQKKRKVYAVEACLSSSNRTYITKFQHEGGAIPYGRFTVWNPGSGRVLGKKKGHKGMSLDRKGIWRYGEEINVVCVPIGSILAKLNISEIDVFFLDIGGDEFNVLRTIPFNRVSIKILSVEYDGNFQFLETLTNYMNDKGFILHNVFSSSSHLGGALFVDRRFYRSSLLASLSNEKFVQIIFNGTGSEQVLGGEDLLDELKLRQF